MARCFLCGKTRQIGRSSKHKRGVAGKQWAKRAQKTLKVFMPNLHVVTLEKNNKKIKTKVCTKCLRRIKKKSETIHGWKAVSVAIKKTEEKPVMVIEKPTEEEEEPSFAEASEGKEKEVKKSSKGRSASGGKKPAPKKSPAKKIK
jgi:ribosomal protein L28